MPTTLLLDKEEMTRILERLACEVLDRHGQCERVMLVGIERRGADLARRLGALMQQKLQRPLPLGTLDINLYRDDWTSLEGKPHIGQSRITAPVDNAEIILIDDVLFSGRTIRAALEALLDYGRPRKVELPVLAEYCLPLVRVGGVFYAMKGSKYQEEADAARHAVEVLGGKIREIRPVQLPGLTDKRAIITIEKVRSTPKQYPRKAGMAVKKPL